MSYNKQWVVDKDGIGMWMNKTSNGRYTGLSFNLDAVENIPNVALRHDDILLCSYSKTGIHWLWENVRMLLTGSVSVDTVEKESQMMEYQSTEVLDKLSSPRILNNHEFFDCQPRDLLKGHTKLILLYRNPYDVAVSFYKHHQRFAALEYKGDLDNFIQRFVDGQVIGSSYFDYLNSFEEGLGKYTDIPVLLVRFEDLKGIPLDERRRIANFLGKSYNDDFLQKVIEATSINTMRQLKVNSHKDVDGSSIIYRKGEVGGWTETLTANQRRIIDLVVEQKLNDSKMFKFVYNL